MKKIFSRNPEDHFAKIIPSGKIFIHYTLPVSVAGTVIPSVHISIESATRLHWTARCLLLLTAGSQNRRKPGHPLVLPQQGTLGLHAGRLLLTAAGRLIYPDIPSAFQKFGALYDTIDIKNPATVSCRIYTDYNSL